MKYLRSICRIIAGLVFIFSGLSKGIDPMGSMYKFIDYFTAFGLNSLDSLALVIGILLSLSEFIIGFALITAIRIRESSWGLLVLMLIFTPLTLILAISNPVSDCGCFGDAIHLSNWQTFLKNVIISGFAIVVFIERKNYPRISSAAREWLIVFFIATGFIIFTQYNIKNLPIIDFRPYRIGININRDMTYPPDEPVDEFESTLIYEKDGVQEEFTLENYPSDDSTWHFVDSRSVLVKKGYTPPIHDFGLVTIYGDDQTDQVLHDQGFSVLMLSGKLSEADPYDLNTGFDAGFNLIANGHKFYILTASSSEEIMNYDNGIQFFQIDETTLKTMIRSNPGYIVIRDAWITAKWSASRLPDTENILNRIENSYPVKGIPEIIKFMITFSIIIVLSLICNLLLKRMTIKKLV